MSNPNLNHLSLCTGYGGIDLGLKAALTSVHTIAYSEIDAFAIENLLSKMGEGLLDIAPIYTDIKSFPWLQIKGQVDILSGGFPCQPFSTAGKGNADNDPRHLWPYIKKGVVELDKPPILFFENVEGLLSSTLKSSSWADPEDTPVLLHILREIERLGYFVTYGVFSARQVGAPQIRKRIFILATHSSMTQQSKDYISHLLLGSEVVAHNWPSGRGIKQGSWEPPRVCEMNASFVFDIKQELKLLGNGVIPQVTTYAFKELWSKLTKEAN